MLMTCPRCAREMTAYVSCPIPRSSGERRIYFACQCGQIAARNETEPVMPREPMDSGPSG